MWAGKRGTGVGEEGSHAHTHTGFSASSTSSVFDTAAAASDIFFGFSFPGFCVFGGGGSQQRTLSLREGGKRKAKACKGTRMGGGKRGWVSNTR